MSRRKTTPPEARVSVTMPTAAHPSPAQSPASADSASITGGAAQSLELLRKRAHKFMSVLPKVFNDEDPKAVHDLRVWSRRLQQVLVTSFPKPRPARARQIVRALRRARRAVGGWRDSDVLLDLALRKTRRIRNSEELRAWESVQESLSRRRVREIARARRKLANRRLLTIAQDIAKLVEPGGHDHRAGGSQRIESPARALSSAIASACEQWRSAEARGRDSLDPRDIHAFRIQTKRLRYRIELARDLGSAEAEAVLVWLKSIQDRLGRLHDRSELARAAAAAVADPDFLVSESRAASLLLRRIAREQKLQEADIRAMLNSIGEGRAQLERWVQHYCGPTQSIEPAKLEDGEAERENP
jgi:CHAD domain-containing protein